MECFPQISELRLESCDITSDMVQELAETLHQMDHSVSITCCFIFPVARVEIGFSLSVNIWVRWASKRCVDVVLV